MLATIDNNNNINVWNGERLPNGMTVQVNVDQLWSDNDLNAMGLYRVQEFVTPDNYNITGPATYTFTGSTVVQTYPIAFIPPLPVKSTGTASAVIK